MTVTRETVLVGLIVMLAGVSAQSANMRDGSYNRDCGEVESRATYDNRRAIETATRRHDEFTRDQRRQAERDQRQIEDIYYLERRDRRSRGY